MAPWVANVVSLSVLSVVVTAWALALLWRIGSWQVSPAESLTMDEGLRIGTLAPEVACEAPDGAEMHLSFGGMWTFLVFGSEGCAPCEDLLKTAPGHPATRPMRRVYVADGDVGDLSPEVLSSWEVYRYHDEDSARETWRAPVSPYFHVIDPLGRIAQKGIANLPDHLDRLLTLRPAALGRPEPEVLTV